MRYGAWVGLAVCLCGAAPTHHNVSQDQDQEQKQVQAQSQDQDQAQRQVQGQVAVGVGGDSRAAQSQATEQANQQTVTTQGQGRSLVQSSPVLYVGQAQEGLAVGLPWANASLGRMSEVMKATTCGSFIAQYGGVVDDRVQQLADQCVRASKRCGVLCHVMRIIN